VNLMRWTEKKLWKYLKPKLKGQWNRIETTAGVGIPDAIGTYKGVTAFIELKVTKSFQVKVRGSQILWHKECYHYGGRSFILVARDNQLTLVNGMNAGFLDSNGLNVVPVVGVYELPLDQDPLFNLLRDIFS